jgi:hypothetical protein
MPGFVSLVQFVEDRRCALTIKISYMAGLEYEVPSLR